MSIEFRCPECEKRLRVPSKSAGTRSNCPQCGAVIEIPQAGSANTGPGIPQDRSLPDPDANPYAEDIFSNPPSSRRAENEPFNPYSAPDSSYSQPVSEPYLSGEVVPIAVNFGDVFNYAWEVWKSNLGLLVGITVVVFGVNFGFAAVQGGVQAVFEQQGERGLGEAFAALISITSSVVQMFLGIGQVQIALKLLRRQPAEFGELFGGGPLFLRVLGASFLAGLAMIAGVIACFVPGLLLMIYFWPFYWLIVDRKAGAIESFGMALPLSKINVGTTIVLALASMGIMLTGFLALCVGALFAAPLVSLIWGTAYLMMSGQLATRSQN